MTTVLITYLRDRHIGRGGELYLSWPISKSDVPQFFPARLCERWGLASANVYKPEQLEGSNTKTD